MPRCARALARRIDSHDLLDAAELVACSSMELDHGRLECCLAWLASRATRASPRAIRRWSLDTARCRRSAGRLRDPLGTRPRLPGAQTMAPDQRQSAFDPRVCARQVGWPRRHRAWPHGGGVRCRSPSMSGRNRPATPPSIFGAATSWARLDAERGKLASAERDFARYRDELLHAKDREDFDRFMRGQSASRHVDGRVG